MDAYLSALRILRYRFNSEAELRRKLRAKRFESEEIDLAIARLHAEKWLDDERFAGALVRTRANRSMGKLRIRRELQAAGVNDETAARAIEQNVDEEREREALTALCDRRARLLVRRYGEDVLSTEEGRAKLANWLVAQGYDASLVWQAVREAGRRRARTP